MAYLRQRNQNSRTPQGGVVNNQLSSTESTEIQGTGTNKSTSPNESGNYVDMNKYLENNEKQIQDFANKSVSGVINKTGEVQGAINKAESDFQKSVDNAKFKEDQNWIDNVFQNSTQFVKDQSNVDRFHTIRDSKWNGAKTLSDVYDPYGTRKDIDYVEDRARAFQTRDGREAYLREANKGTRYSPNLSRLDSALLQGSDKARGTFVDTGKDIENKNLLGTLMNKETEADNLYKTTKDFNKAFSDKVKSNFNPTFENHKTELQGYANEVNKNAKGRDDLATAYNMQSQPVWVPDYNYSDANGETGIWVNMPNAVNPFELGDPLGDQQFKDRLNERLGVDNKAYDILRNRDQANMNTVANEDDLAKLEALNLLGGDEFKQDYLSRDAYRNQSLRNFGDKTDPTLWNKIMEIDQNRRYSPNSY
ncbi:hypothetical protein EHR02_00135 [Leptospira levettii]|uniref:hypothetical protein n=1 Tax=Leptospira levettii TaxID=2023178 RepID=UPI0010826BBC|nr:hypothetical protein [Leptospira levettii]TGM95046.1 hypothetical protein EHR02_00135 [Leptospira levettii]